MNNFKHGDMVEVLDTNKYKEVHVGAIGTVRSTYEGRVTVMFDSIHNPRSSYDCFYFNVKQLKLYEGDKIMDGNYRIATIRFLDEKGDKTYSYALYDEKADIGDICVVKSAHHGMGVAVIIDIGPKTEEKIIREVVCVCDFAAYVAREDKRKRKEELKRKMAARAAQLQELALYKMMADSDADMSDMLKEFEGLGDC